MKIWQLLLAINRLNEQHGVLLAQYLDVNTPLKECQEIYQELHRLENQAAIYGRQIVNAK